MSGRQLFLVGLSHKSAPIEVRERVALTGDALKDALVDLKRMEGVEEAFVVSTCNRVEVFVQGQHLAWPAPSSPPAPSRPTATST